MADPSAFIMVLLTREDVIAAVSRLGELAAAEGRTVDLLLVGGGAMVVAFGARSSTRDVDAIVMDAGDAGPVRRYAAVIAVERGWPPDWLNDGAKGFLVGPVTPTLLFASTGVRLSRPSTTQLLAMKLCAWRDNLDIADARRLLAAVAGGRDEVWSEVLPFLQPGRELTARLGFDDLWEDRT